MKLLGANVPRHQKLVSEALPGDALTGMTPKKGLQT